MGSARGTWRPIDLRVDFPSWRLDGSPHLDPAGTKAAHRDLARGSAVLSRSQLGRPGVAPDAWPLGHRQEG